MKLPSSRSVLEYLVSCFKIYLVLVGASLMWGSAVEGYRYLSETPDVIAIFLAGGALLFFMFLGSYYIAQFIRRIL